MSTKQTHLYGLDVVRFFSALSVCLFHIGFTAWKNPDSGGRDIVNYAYPELVWANFGWVGVEIFFVISGFVIAASAADRDLWGFVRSRVLRLYPAVWICAPITAMVAIALGLYGTPELLNRFARGITLFPLYPWIEGVYWTLGVEIIFYGAVAAFVGAGRFDRIGELAALLTLASFIYNVSGIDVGLQWSRVTLLAHGCFFAVGIYFWQYTRGKFSWMVVPAFAGCVVEILKHQGYVARQTDIPYGYSALIVWLGAMAAILLSWHGRDRVPVFASSLRKLGNATYPLYLVHFTLGVTICSLLTGKLPGIGPVVAAVAAVVILAWLIAEFAEPIVRGGLARVLTSLEARTSGVWRRSSET